MTRTTRLPALAILSILPVLSACSASGASGPEDPADQVAAVEGLITQDYISAGIAYLADDLLEGRGVGSRGGRLARRYLATQMQGMGLSPGGVNGTWEQPVPMVGITATVETPMTVRGPHGEASFTAPEDYTCEAGRPDPATGWQEREIVFVGYGIHAPEQKWDDFKGADVAGKVLLVMNNDPSSDPNLFAGKTRLYYGRWSYKYEEAARRGAVGAIVIHTTPSAGYPFDVIRNTHGREDFWLEPEKGVPTLALRSWCSEAAARKIAKLGGKDLDALRAAAERRDFHPVPLGIAVTLNTSNKIRHVQSANVLGKLVGSDAALKNQVVVMTAHFDHLGISRPDRTGDTIYNGALDNASGTAAMLAIARAAAALERRPRRTILFAAVTAEESGLLGSLYYARNPTYPIKQVVADFNIDSINIWGVTKDIAMVGHGKNSLTQLATEVAERRGRRLIANPDVSLGLFYRSDHFSFARVGVPSVYFTAGKRFLADPERSRRKVQLMMAYTMTRYHKPNDEYNPDWDLSGAVADAQLMLGCLVRCANADDPPTWTPGDEFEKLR
ncbi:MAG: M28 family peptidase [Planctomycetota bacterium]|jgi:hypothetical protein